MKKSELLDFVRRTYGDTWIAKDIGKSFRKKYGYSKHVIPVSSEELTAESTNKEI